MTLSHSDTSFCVKRDVSANNFVDASGGAQTKIAVFVPREETVLAGADFTLCGDFGLGSTH